MSVPHSDTGEELRLIELAQGGDLDAFDRLVRMHFSRVYALLFRMIHNHEDAEDLAQECFLKAQRSLGWYRREARFSTWLFKIAVHLSRDHYRRVQRAPRIAPVAEADEHESSARGPADQSARRELLAGVREGLDRLPHRLRVALVLRTQESMEYDEIAAVLGIGAQTARVHVMKARRLLERWIQPWTGESSS